MTEFVISQLDDGIERLVVPVIILGALELWVFLGCHVQFSGQGFAASGVSGALFVAGGDCAFRGYAQGAPWSGQRIS